MAFSELEKKILQQIANEGVITKKEDALAELQKRKKDQAVKYNPIIQVGSAVKKGFDFYNKSKLEQAAGGSKLDKLNAAENISRLRTGVLGAEKDLGFKPSISGAKFYEQSGNTRFGDVNKVKLASQEAPSAVEQGAADAFIRVTKKRVEDKLKEMNIRIEAKYGLTIEQTKALLPLIESDEGMSIEQIQEALSTARPTEFISATPEKDVVKMVYHPILGEQKNYHEMSLTEKSTYHFGNLLEGTRSVAEDVGTFQPVVRAYEAAAEEIPEAAEALSIVLDRYASGEINAGEAILMSSLVLSAGAVTTLSNSAWAAIPEEGKDLVVEAVETGVDASKTIATEISDEVFRPVYNVVNPDGDYDAALQASLTEIGETIGFIGDEINEFLNDNFTKDQLAVSAYIAEGALNALDFVVGGKSLKKGAKISDEISDISKQVVDAFDYEDYLRIQQRLNDAQSYVKSKLKDVPGEARAKAEKVVNNVVGRVQSAAKEIKKQWMPEKPSFKFPEKTLAFIDDLKKAQIQLPEQEAYQEATKSLTVPAKIFSESTISKFGYSPFYTGKGLTEAQKIKPPERVIKAYANLINNGKLTTSDNFIKQIEAVDVEISRSYDELRKALLVDIYAGRLPDSVSVKDVDSMIEGLVADAVNSKTYSTVQVKTIEKYTGLYKDIITGKLTKADEKLIQSKAFQKEIERLKAKALKYEADGQELKLNTLDVLSANQIFDHMIRNRDKAFGASFQQDSHVIDRVLAGWDVRGLNKDILNMSNIPAAELTKSIQSQASALYDLRHYLDLLRARDKVSSLEKTFRSVGAMLGSQGTPWFTATDIKELAYIGAGITAANLAVSTGAPMVVGAIAFGGVSVGLNKMVTLVKKSKTALRKKLRSLLLEADDKVDFFDTYNEAMKVFEDIENIMKPQKGKAADAVSDIRKQQVDMDDIRK